MSVPRWSVVAPERQPVHGGRDYPSVRYSAMAVAYKGELIMTHGYFYNHAIRHPAWKSDAYALEIDGHRPIVDLWARARSAWSSVREADAVDGDTLLVCHGSLGQALLCTALRHDESHWRVFEFPNTGMCEIEWRERGFDEPARWRWRLPVERADGVWRSRGEK